MIEQILWTIAIWEIIKKLFLPALVESYKIIIPKEELKQSKYLKGYINRQIENAKKWQQEIMYSEEDMISFAHFYFQEEFNSTMQTSKSTDEIFNE